MGGRKREWVGGRVSEWQGEWEGGRGSVSGRKGGLLSAQWKYKPQRWWVGPWGDCL